MKVAQWYNKGCEVVPKANLDYVDIMLRKWLESLRKQLLFVLQVDSENIGCPFLYPVMLRDCISLSYTYANS